MPSASEVGIRAADAGDAATIHALLERLAESIGKPGGIKGAPADLARFGFGEPPLFEALIAESGGEAVGLALFFPEYSSWRGRPGLYVQDLFVDPGLRGGGLGLRLLREVARRAAAIGGVYVRLSVDHANTSGQGFYARAGFRHAEEERIFVVDGDAFAALSGEG